jgi:2-amino-4-hydroxy-6-hydroxymethyldihydropteridine diphosphokinase
MIKGLSSVLASGITSSYLMETEPIGVLGKQNAFYNVIVRGKYNGTALQLLSDCNRIENELGRIRVKRYMPRTADIDILLFGHERINQKHLIVPHPRISYRRFCIQGLFEVAPYWFIPGIELPVYKLLKTMQYPVKKQVIAKVKDNCFPYTRGSIDG